MSLVDRGFCRLSFSFSWGKKREASQETRASPFGRGKKMAFCVLRARWKTNVQTLSFWDKNKRAGDTFAYKVSRIRGATQSSGQQNTFHSGIWNRVLLWKQQFCQLYRNYLVVHGSSGQHAVFFFENPTSNPAKVNNFFRRTKINKIDAGFSSLNNPKHLPRPVTPEPLTKKFHDFQAGF